MIGLGFSSVNLGEFLVVFQGNTGKLVQVVKCKLWMKIMREYFEI